jgi:hypothetical protein
VEAVDALVNGPSPHIGIVDASVYSACLLTHGYETEHGLAEGAALPGSGRGGGDFDFTTMRSRCGYFQGCFLSTEKAKIFMASLIEAIDTMVSGGRGRDAPVGTAEDATLLARFRAQRWRISPDGRSLRCQVGSNVAQASVIVQLYAASLPIAIEAFDREQLSRAKRLEPSRLSTDPAANTHR